MRNLAFRHGAISVKQPLTRDRKRCSNSLLPTYAAQWIRKSKQVPNNRSRVQTHRDEDASALGSPQHQAYS